MKVIKKGRPQKGWAKEFLCSGNGNGGGGCGATLLVEQGDLFQTSNQSYGDSSPDFFITFKCVECGVLTDIRRGDCKHINPASLPDIDKWNKSQKKA